MTDLRVTHLDHSTAKGGAEFALLRMLLLPPAWRATLVLPRSSARDDGVYQALESSETVRVKRMGPAQYFGASKGSVGIFGFIAYGLRMLGAAIALRASSAFKHADVIHANTSRSAVYGAMACAVSRKKFVVHLRDMTNVEGLGKIGYALFTRLALRRADGVIGNSQATLNSALPYLKPSQARAVIASAAGLTAASTQTSTREVKVIGMVARLDPWKGQDVLLRAFASRFSAGDVELWFAGSAPFGNEAFEAELRGLAKEKGIEGRVKFLGHIDDVTSVIESFDICVQASTRPEPLGQNVLQYLHAAKPVVAVNAGGPADWISHRENGLLFESGSEIELASALEELVTDDRLRLQLAVNARDTPGLMTDRQITDAHAEFFERVARGANSLKGGAV